MKRACLLFFLILLGTTTTLRAEDTFKIGAILPLTGEFSPVGQDLRSGMQLALADHKNSGVKIYFEDDQSFNKVSAVRALNKLLNVDGVKLIFNSVVNTIEPLAPALNRKKVPGIVIWDSNSKIANLGRYVFGMGYSTELAGSDMAKFAGDKLGVKNLAIVSANDEWSEIISNAFKVSFLDSGRDIFLHERFDVSEDSFRTLIVKLKKEKVDGVYCPLFDASLVAFIRQARELNFRGVILTADGLTPHAISVLGKYAEGVYATQVSGGNSTLMAKYKKFFGADTEPDQIGFVALGYDAVDMIVELNRNKKDDSLIAAISNYNAEGLSGPISFSVDGLSNKKESIYIVTSGKLELVSDSRIESN